MKFNDTLENISNYEAGKPIELVVREFGIASSDVTKLASNENPFGCSPKVQAAVAEIVGQMSLYPDDSMYALKQALAGHFSIAENNLIIGAGSDQVIEFAVRVKTGPSGKILTNAITFAMYEIYAAQVGAEVIKTDSQAHDLNQFYQLYQTHKPDIIFICTPNNPTGDALDASDLLQFLEKIDDNTLVVVDCAYMEYAAQKDAAKTVYAKDLLKFSNVLYLGTFSKAYGLGGMRVGYGIASPEIIAALYKMRPPFNVTTLSLAAALAALQDQAFVDMSVKSCIAEMQRYQEFAEQQGLLYIDSYTNFITLLLSGQNSSEISQALMRQGMIVRDLASYQMNAIRVTIGNGAQNQRLFELLRPLL